MGLDEALSSWMDLRASAAIVALLSIWLMVRVAHRSKVARIDAADRRTDWGVDDAYGAWLDRALAALRRKSEGFSAAEQFVTVQGDEEMRFAVRAVSEKVLVWDGNRLKLSDESRER